MVSAWHKVLKLPFISFPSAVPLDDTGDGEECGRQVGRLQKVSSWALKQA